MCDTAVRLQLTTRHHVVFIAYGTNSLYQFNRGGQQQYTAGDVRNNGVVSPVAEAAD